MIDENVAPTPKPGVDFSSLSPSPTPEQYFLLSRLDGKLTVAELCKISGLGRQKTLEALESLATAGAIEVPGFKPPGAAHSSAAAASSVVETTPSRPSSKEKKEKSATAAKAKKAEKAEKKKKGRSKKKVVPNYPTPPREFDFDQGMLSQDVPLDEDHRRELICLHEQMAQMTFYDIFGVQPGASKKDIKKAYFRMSKRYHPDKFFRKEMGDFGPMLETVFKEITKAYRTLSSKRKRKDYDAELGAQTADVRSNNPNAAATTSSGGTPVVKADPGEQNKRKAAAVLLMRRAEKLQGQGEYRQAASEYRKALALNRDAELAVRVARMLLDEAALPQEAVSFARAALKLDADEVSARIVLAQAHEAAGARQSAISEYQKVLIASPEHPKAEARLEKLGATS